MRAFCTILSDLLHSERSHMTWVCRTQALSISEVYKGFTLCKVQPISLSGPLNLYNFLKWMRVLINIYYNRLWHTLMYLKLFRKAWLRSGCKLWTIRASTHRMRIFSIGRVVYSPSLSDKDRNRFNSIFLSKIFISKRNLQLHQRLYHANIYTAIPQIPTCCSHSARKPSSFPSGPYNSLSHTISWMFTYVKIFMIGC